MAVYRYARYYESNETPTWSRNAQMPLDELNEQNFRSYISANAAKTDGLWVLVHVPKTSGTSLGSQLMRGRQPSRNIYVSWEGIKRADSRKSLDLVLDEYLTSDEISTARFMTGHFDGRQADRIQAARPDCRFLTMLRNPVERVLSEYRYMLTEKHPAHEVFRTSFPNIELYIDHPRSQNIMFKRLAPMLPMTNQEAFEFIRKRFTFVGLTEEYELSLRIISQLTGVPLDASSRLNVTERIAENEVAVTPELQARIEETNKRDMALYRHFSNLFRRCARSLPAPALSPPLKAEA